MISVGFHGAADENGTVSIGYSLIPSVRGQRYAYEALHALLLFARGRGITCVKGHTTRVAPVYLPVLRQPRVAGRAVTRTRRCGAVAALLQIIAGDNVRGPWR